MASRAARLPDILGHGGLLWCCLALFALLGTSGRAYGTVEPAATPAPNSDASCLDCHSDETLWMKKDGKKISLFVDEKIGAKSAHRSLDCIDCHEKFDGDSTPHRKPMVAVDCISCHEDTAKKHAFHPRLALTPIPAGDDTACKTCHGTHNTVAVKSAAFAFRDGPQAGSCGKCHQAARDHFAASAHGRAFAAKEPNAPDCLTCHQQPIVAVAPAKPTLAQKLAQTKQC